jgi:hypothetical protein
MHADGSGRGIRLWWSGAAINTGGKLGVRDGLVALGLREERDSFPAGDWYKLCLWDASCLHHGDGLAVGDDNSACLFRESIRPWQTWETSAQLL